MIVNYQRNDLGWIGENVDLVIKWLITGTVYLHIVLILSLLTRSRSMHLLNRNWKL